MSIYVGPFILIFACLCLGFVVGTWVGARHEAEAWRMRAQALDLALMLTERSDPHDHAVIATRTVLATWPGVKDEP